MGLLTLMRTVLHGSDQRRAVADERFLLSTEADRQGTLERQLAAAFSDMDEAATTLGTMVGSERPIRLPVQRLCGHVGIWGPSGCGKSYFVVKLLTTLLRSGMRRLVICDPKAETVGLLKRAIVDVAASLPLADGEDLLRRVICLDLFLGTALPRLQLLAPVPGLDPELHAYAVARLITEDSDMGVGVRQEALLHRCIECLIRAALPLTVLPDTLREPLILEALAERHAPGDLFRATAARVRECRRGSESAGGR